MYLFKKVNDKVLEVQEVIKGESVSYVYYDLNSFKKSATVNHPLDKPVFEIPFTEQFMSWLTKQFYSQLKACGIFN